MSFTDSLGVTFRHRGLEVRKSSEWYADYMKKSNNNSLAIMQNKQVVHLYSLWTLCWLLYNQILGSMAIPTTS